MHFSPKYYVIKVEICFSACTQADRSEFNSHVTELIMSEYGSLHGRTMPEGKISDHKKERIEWKFDQMDVNR